MKLMVCAQGLHTLCQYAFEDTDVSTSQEALRCIANALLLEPKMRQVVVDLGYAPNAADRLKACLSHNSKDTQLTVCSMKMSMTSSCALAFSSS